VIVDANVLLYAVDEASPFHVRARDWLTEHLNGAVRIGLPWPSLLAFHRIATTPRMLAAPLSAAQSWELVEAWLAAPASWLPVPGERHGQVLAALVARYHVSGRLTPDASLAALAIEHGVAVASADADFARFRELEWINPIEPPVD
jgi:toxin-antitoxin system PIN domain toxin